MKTVQACISVMAIVVVSLVLGCANAKPVDYHSGNEIPEGPGLFSKDKGDFTIYSSEKQKTESAEKRSDQTAGGVSEVPSEPAPADNNEEFQQFKKWQAEQKEFEAFQQWKQSPQNAGEYQEFQEWKRWKAYQEWRKSQQKPQ